MSTECVHMLEDFQPTRLAGVTRCRCGSWARSECSFCGFTITTLRGWLRDRIRDGWRYFGVRRRVPPQRFPIDIELDPHDEQVEWMCCPDCLAESGVERLTAYLNEPCAMRPEPACRRVTNARGDVISETGVP
jgi:hypothetical protein